jgi:hypothetical protein
MQSLIRLMVKSWNFLDKDLYRLIRR